MQYVVTLLGSKRHCQIIEGKAELEPNDQWKIKHLLEQVKEDDKKLEQLHLKVLNFTEEDQDTLEAKESVCNEHVSQVVENQIIERLEQVRKLKSPCHSQKQQLFLLIIKRDHYSIYNKRRLRSWSPQTHCLQNPKLTPDCSYKSAKKTSVC